MSGMLPIDRVRERKERARPYDENKQQLTQPPTDPPEFEHVPPDLQGIGQRDAEQNEGNQEDSDGDNR